MGKVKFSGLIGLWYHTKYHVFYQVYESVSNHRELPASQELAGTDKKHI